MSRRTRITLAAAVAALSLVTVGLAAPSAMAYPNTTCDGQLGDGAWQNVTVEKGKTCSIGIPDASVTPTIYGDLKVSEDAQLFDLGVPISGTLSAKKAAALAVVENPDNGPLYIGEVKVTETKESFGYNYLCARVGHDLVIQNSAPSARWIIGNADGNCTGMPVGHNVTLQGNRAQLAMNEVIADGNITVQKNTGETVVWNDSAHGNITFQGNTGVGSLFSNHADGICKFQGNGPLLSGTGNTDMNGLLNSCNTF
jgi:hypothetical protein